MFSDVVKDNTKVWRPRFCINVNVELLDVYATPDGVNFHVVSSGISITPLLNFPIDILE